MAQRQIQHQWNAQIAQAFLQDLVHREIAGKDVVFSPAEAAAGHPRQLLQQACAAPLGQHPINPVGRFAHIFQHQDGPLQGGKPGRADQVGRHGQVGDHQGSARDPPPSWLAQQGRHGTSAEQVHRALPLRLCAAAGSMDGPRQASGPLGQQQGAGVGEPQAPFGMARKTKTGFEHAGGPPAPAKGHHGIHRWIVPG